MRFDADRIAREAVQRAEERVKDSAAANDIPAILSANEFMAGFEPPDYIIDGIIQRGRLYALTSPTGHGKTAVALCGGCMVAAGRDIGGIEVTQGAVVFLAGENPDDLRCRLHATCQIYRLDPTELPFHVLPGNFPLTAESAELLKQRVDELKCSPVLIIPDTRQRSFPATTTIRTFRWVPMLETSACSQPAPGSQRFWCRHIR